MKSFLYRLLFVTFFSIPFFASAQFQYQHLQSVTIPGGKNLYSGNILQYLANIYTFAIAIAGGLAVVRIVYAGIKYMTSDAFGLKGEAKKEIQAAVIGLLMALGSYVFLYTLNPNLVKFSLKIGATQQMVGSGSNLFTNSTTGTVSGGRPSTPGVNNPPSTPGAEIVPALPEGNASDNNPNGPDGSLLPPRDNSTTNDSGSSNTLPTYNLNEGSSNNQSSSYTDGSYPVYDNTQTTNSNTQQNTTSGSQDSFNVNNIPTDNINQPSSSN